MLKSKDIPFSGTIKQSSLMDGKMAKSFFEVPAS
jgi:hypothetical protein